MPYRPLLHALWLTLSVVIGCRGAEAPTGPLGLPMAGSAPARGDAMAALAPGDAGTPDAEGLHMEARPLEPMTPGGLAAVTPCTTDDTSTVEGTSAPRDTLTLTQVGFSELPGWADDNLAEAVPAFLHSCEKLRALQDDAPVGADGHGGKARNWRKVCAAAAKVPAGDDAAARAMFEAEFVPYLARGTTGPTGKLTGFYVAELHASKTRHGRFQTPVLARPDDLVMVDLSDFLQDAHARRIWGRMDHGELVPYYTRAQIRKGVLAKRGLELMYVDDPVDLLFAQIEGSAKANLDDGTSLWLEFAGKNGRAYKGVGGILRNGGFLQPGEGTMQGIRAWFHDHPTRFDEIADQDASYVFFTVSKLPGAVGSQKTVLTARRSMAVDRAFIALSTPIWIEAKVPVPGKKRVTVPWHHLLIAQDTGAGIVGAVRGDIYWGDDAEAAELGGRMGGPGKYWLLLPRGITK
ncbi:MAG TPA: murein transglycosylase A [Kofleriaceae bacterium]|jgi:membrane-bound lytic murein transglycosylase A|nr:murein transglycosylase A [Kofleriaceae bacterium]